MLNTKLILIEGLPGAGKSTTARQLGALLRHQGCPCQWYLEEDQPHPIACLDFPLKQLTQKLPPLWRSFAQQVLQESSVAIIESRLWQNTALFMHMSHYPLTEIIELQHLVTQEIACLSPALVYLCQDDVAAALRRLYTFRDEATINTGIQMTEAYPWFQSRGLHGFTGWVQFFQDWQGVAEELYADWPYLKLRVVNAHVAWATAYQQMSQFLKIEPRP